MCSLCEENEDGYEVCQDCGIMICFDVDYRDDVISGAYVTESGDLYCRECGREHDKAEYEDDFMFGPCGDLP